MSQCTRGQRIDYRVLVRQVCPLHLASLTLMNGTGSGSPRERAKRTGESKSLWTPGTRCPLYAARGRMNTSVSVLLRRGSYVPEWAILTHRHSYPSHSPEPYNYPLSSSSTPSAGVQKYYSSGFQRQSDTFAVPGGKYAYLSKQPAINPDTRFLVHSPLSALLLIFTPSTLCVALTGLTHRIHHPRVLDFISRYELYHRSRVWTRHPGCCAAYWCVLLSLFPSHCPLGFV